MEKPTGSPSDESVPDEEDEGWQEKKEDLIQVEEEADLIQAERFLDDAVHRDTDRDRESQRKKKDEEDVEVLAELMLAMAVGKTQSEEEQPPGQSQTELRTRAMQSEQVYQDAADRLSEIRMSMLQII
ncbi:NFX1-type zinc finger-containing protein 1-like isoform X2 [Clupea harengus]|nr:NFX1-type zinc finger-containing protein 1-like isoform X2 [Clupea harengus]